MLHFLIRFISLHQPAHRGVVHAEMRRNGRHRMLPRQIRQRDRFVTLVCAGNYAETLGLHKVSELDGVGRRMPWTTVSFTVAALGMIGLPPMAGFISKWYLGLGALEAGMPWVLAVLAASSLLNAAYFLPILHRVWFRPASASWPDEKIPLRRGWETAPLLLIPPLVTAAATLALGLFAGASMGPLEWARRFVGLEYLQWAP